MRSSLRWITRLVIAAAGCSLLATPLAVPPSSADISVQATGSTGPKPGGAQRDRLAAPVRVAEPDKTLGSGWRQSRDRAITAATDIDGVNILVADSSDAYAWRTAAVLAEPGVPAESWIGNQCSMDGSHVAVAYAPRSFTNKPDLMQGGGFAAIVNVETREVLKLTFNVTLASFSPGCNPQTRSATFTAYRGMDDLNGVKTRMVTVGVDGDTNADVAVDGQITSAVPVDGGVIGAKQDAIVRIDRAGQIADLTDAAGTPSDLRPAKGGGVAYLERISNNTTRATIWNRGNGARVMAKARLGDLSLEQGAEAIFLTGTPSGVPAVTGSGITVLDAPVDADISSRGRLATTAVLTPGVRTGLARIANAGKGATQDSITKDTPSARGDRLDSKPDEAGSPTVTAVATSTGTAVTLSVQDSGMSASASRLSPSLNGRFAGQRTSAVSHDPTDPERWCAVSRNDINMQALQPTPNQIEWAVDMAVRGELRGSRVRQGGYRGQTGLASVDPQALFPAPTLTGGYVNGRVPANVLLGVLAQE